MDTIDTEECEQNDIISASTIKQKDNVQDGKEHDQKTQKIFDSESETPPSLRETNVINFQTRCLYFS